MFKKSKVKRKTPFLVFASIITLLMIMPVIFSSSLFFDDAPKWSFILSNLFIYLLNLLLLSLIDRVILNVIFAQLFLAPFLALLSFIIMKKIVFK